MNDHNSWRRRIGRSGKSNSNEPQQHQLRASPPDSLPPAPPSPGNPPIVLPQGLSATPPKKTWERQYKSFLTRRVLGHSPRSSSSAGDDNDSSGRGSSGGLKPRSRLFRSRSKSNDVLPPVRMPEIPNIMPSKSNEDVAIRGGNFFQSVFSSKKMGEATATTPHHSVMATTTTTPPTATTTIAMASDGPVSPSQRQRAKSMDARKKSSDSLDSTLRGGHEKTLSPLVQRHLRKFSDRESPVHGGISAQQQQQQHQQKSRHVGHLPAALVSGVSASKSREMKKAFTEFHNSSQFSLDASSAYLGDDPSIRPSNYLAMPKRTSAGARSEVDLVNLLKGQKESRGSSLPTVTEDVVIQKSTRVLKPIQGPESWETGRRYLIAPAALSVCPLQVLRGVTGKARVQDYTTSAFGTIELGKATVKYVGGRQQHYSGSSWSTCKFLLKQNYLLEYDVNGSETAAPRGFAHLQYAKCTRHLDFSDALELEFYASPCAKSDKRVLFVRLANRDDRDRWVRCLNDAARLTIKDLYDYDEERQFGRGHYAVVHPARRRRGPLVQGEEDSTVDSKEYTCALKIIDKTEFWRRVVKGMERADTIVRETSVQATVAAKFASLSAVLQIRGAFETSDNYVIELELLEGTDLFQHVSSKTAIEEDESARIMYDILTSLDAMARVGIAHRDIKPANILMSDQEKSGVSVKVADFGMACFAGVDGNLRGRCGTPGYVAPEIFTTPVHGGYGNKVDVFSAGVTLYVLLCGYEPFYGESDAELIAANKAAIVEYPECDWSKISLEARDLVEQMLERDPKKRISAKDALQHPWIVRRVATDDTRRPHSPSLLSATEEGTACTIS